MLFNFQMFLQFGSRSASWIGALLSQLKAHKMQIHTRFFDCFDVGGRQWLAAANRNCQNAIKHKY